MGKVERAIEAIESLPEHQRDEIADIVLELAAAIQGEPGRSALDDAQMAELRRRLATGYQPGDASRIDMLLARLK